MKNGGGAAEKGGKRDAKRGARERKTESIFGRTTDRKMMIAYRGR